MDAVTILIAALREIQTERDWVLYTLPEFIDALIQALEGASDG